MQREDAMERPLAKLIALIPKLATKDVRIKNPTEAMSKLRTLIEGGLDKMQVIADFDHTLSRYHYNGSQCLTAAGAIRASSLVPAEVGAKLKALRDRYYPIEINHEMPVEEKIPYMVKWWTEGQRAQVDAGITQGMIKEIAKTANVKLRCGTEKMFEVLKEHSVPLLIFSAGAGDMIEAILRNQGPIPPNVHLIANRIEFDSEGKPLGRKGTLIHVFNKNETVAHHASYFEDLSHRHNVLLIGDSTGDSQMADGVVDPNVIFKIGFLNDHIEERLNLFLDAFDVVLLDDQTMDLANEIIEAAKAS